jgi:hypothetical protein
MIRLRLGNVRAVVVVVVLAGALLGGWLGLSGHAHGAGHSHLTVTVGIHTGHTGHEGHPQIDTSAQKGFTNEPTSR